MSITDADRKEAWPFAQFHCLPDRQMRQRWFSGYYDGLSEGAAIRAFARHRTAQQCDGSAVAVVGKDWSLLWASQGTLTDIVADTGIKVGSLLYARQSDKAGAQ